jgi:type IV pilus assembly protein PilV
MIRLKTGQGRSRHCAGFSLVEVLVALVVVSIGLLGLAKMESLAISSADISGTRAIAAMQAASLAAMMHADHDYWASANATTGATVTYGTTSVSVSDTNLAPSGTNPTCTISGSNACTPTFLAAADLQSWGTTLNSLLPGYSANIICTPATLAASPPTPVTCTITISWAENGIAMDSQQNNLQTAATYTLNVEP